jgi:hypothetical protein
MSLTLIRTRFKVTFPVAWPDEQTNRQRFIGQSRPID